jgi:hypothetical protein
MLHWQHSHSQLAMGLYENSQLFPFWQHTNFPKWMFKHPHSLTFFFGFGFSLSQQQNSEQQFDSSFLRIGFI